MMTYAIPAMRPSMASTMAAEYGYNIYEGESYYGKFPDRTSCVTYKVRGVIHTFKPRKEAE